MVTVATFTKVEEAHLLRMRLEAAGIPAFLRDEATAQIWGGSADIGGGVKVEIADEDVEAARAVLTGEEITGEPQQEG